MLRNHSTYIFLLFFAFINSACSPVNFSKVDSPADVQVIETIPTPTPSPVLLGSALIRNVTSVPKNVLSLSSGVSSEGAALVGQTDLSQESQKFDLYRTFDGKYLITEKIGGRKLHTYSSTVSVTSTDPTLYSLKPQSTGYQIVASNNGCLTLPSSGAVVTAITCTTSNTQLWTLSGVTVPVEVYQPKWVRCAVDGGSCSFTGTRTIRYGSDGNFIAKTFIGKTGCNLTKFAGSTALNSYCEIDLNSGTPRVFVPTEISTTGPTSLNVQVISERVGFQDDTTGTSFAWGGMTTPHAFVQYNILVREAGSYNIEIYTSSFHNSGFEVLVDDVSKTIIPTQITGSLMTYIWNYPTSVQLTAGEHRVIFRSIGGFATNLGGIRLEKIN